MQRAELPNLDTEYVCEKIFNIRLSGFYDALKANPLVTESLEGAIIEVTDYLGFQD